MDNRLDLSAAFAADSALRRWAAHGVLQGEALEQALKLAGPQPDADAWRRFVQVLTLNLGVLLVGAGVVCLVAFNWADLSKFGKLYGLQGLLVAGAVLAWKLGPDRASGKAVLLLSGIFLGALLALIGQTYQTGADTWELFAIWALLLIPWALAANWPPLWLLWIALLNTAGYLMLVFDHGRWGWLPRSDWVDPWLIIASLNCGLLMAWELAARRWPELDVHYGPRLLLLFVLTPVVVATLWMIVGFGDDNSLLRLLLCVALLAGLFVAYRRWFLDLAALALLSLSGIVLLTTLFGRILVETNLDFLAWFFLSMSVVVEAAMVAIWLRRLSKEAKHESA